MMKKGSEQVIAGKKLKDANSPPEQNKIIK